MSVFYGEHLDESALEMLRQEVIPAMAQRAALVREARVARAEQPRAVRRRTLAAWIGARLIAVGERLDGRPVAAPTRSS